MNHLDRRQFLRQTGKLGIGAAELAALREAGKTVP
jgi:hypothetical protein